MLELQDMEIAVVCGPDKRTQWLRVLGYSRIAQKMSRET